MMVVRRDSDDSPTASAAGGDSAHSEPVTMAAIHGLEQHLARLATQMDRVEETLRFTQRSLEDLIRRSEGIAAEWLQEISTSMSARFAEAEETIQRVEHMVTGSRQTNHVVRLPWMARLAVPVLALVTAAAIGVLITRGRDTAPEKVASAPATPLATTPPTTEPSASAPPVSREERVSAPLRRSANRAPASIASRPTTYVGSLSIASVPPGASVSINGRAAGVTPLRLHRQRAGSHAVQIAEEGFERWSAAVRVSADRLTEVTAKLRPIAP